MPQPDYRIHEMNKRLQQRTDDSDNLWWDAFATEFFEDDANLTLTFCLEDGPKRYSKYLCVCTYYAPTFISANFHQEILKNSSCLSSLLYYIPRHYQLINLPLKNKLTNLFKNI